ncbi:MAG: hypothetical protein ACW96U_09060 [Candidatus Heimdallarchaeaceae archaeon]
MTPKIEQKLDEIQQMIVKGEYFEALENVKEVQEKKDLSQQEIICLKVLECQTEYWIGLWSANLVQIEKAVNLGTQAFEKSSEINDLVLMSKSLFSIGHPHWYLSKYDDLVWNIEKNIEIYEKIQAEKLDELGKLESYYNYYKGVLPFVHIYSGKEVPKDHLEESIKLLEHALKLADKHNDSRIKYHILQDLTASYYRIGNQERRFHYLQEFLEFTEIIGNKYWIAEILWLQSLFYYNRGEYEKHLELQLRRLNIYESINNEVGIAWVNWCIAFYYLAIGEKEQALENLFKTLDFFEKIKDERRVGWLKLDIGLVYRMKGDLEQAYNYTKQAFDILFENKPPMWWKILKELSQTYILMGEVDEALELQEEILAFQRNLDYKSEIASVLHEIGKIYWQKGLKNRAIELVSESSILFEKFGNDFELGLILADLIYFLTEINELDKALNYQEKLKKINSVLKNREIEQKYSFSEALILRKSSDTRERLKAEIILERLLREDLNYNFQVSILLVLTEQLLLELQVSGDIKLLSGVQKHILDLYTLTTGNNSYILSSEVLLLQAKLALIELDSNKALQLLNRAENIAEDKGLDRLKELIAIEKVNFKEEVIKIEQLDTKSPISKRMEVIDFKRSINGIKKASVTDTKVEKSDLSDKLFSIQI